MIIEIRQAASGDVPMLLPLVAAYWDFEEIPGFAPQPVAAQLTRLFSEPNLGGGWIAWADGEAAAYLLAVYVFSLEHLGLTAEIDEFYVRPPHRGRNVGQALLAAAEAEFIRVGCTNVSLQLARDNEAARAFYHRQGYTERADYELLDKMLR